MAEAPTHSLTCPTLIGRVAQRAQLFAQLEQARQGYGQLAVINGEAGVGKSRLVAEVTRQAMAAGMPVTQVRCYAEDHAAPYGPLLALLHHHLSHRPVADLRAALGDGAGELGRLAPALRAGAPPAEDLAGGKRRLWQALQQLVTGLPETGPLVASPSRPLLLLFEDLHWCDEATLEFLIVLARQTPDRPHFLVITYRPDEMTPPLMRFLAAIARDLPAGEYPLSRLNEEEVEAMLCAIFRLARPPQADFREALFRLTGGNPFFIEEVLKACVAEGSIFPLGDQWGRKPLGQLQIPRTVQLAVQQRMAQLTPAAQELLVLAAVAGQRWAFDLLLRTSGQSERALIALVKELIASQLVVEEAPDQFAFRHALTQQAVYAGLLARERRLYHQQIADTLEQMLVATPGAGETATLTEGALARHAAAAGQWARALHYAGRAGEQAQQLQAPRSAVEHYTRALSAVQALGQPPLLALLHARGECYEMLGDFAAAQSDWEAMLDGAAAAGDRRHHWQALLNLGFLWTSRDFGRAAAYYDRALDLARTLADPAALARTLNRIGNWHVNMEDPHLGQRYHQEALQIFEQMGDLPGKAATLDLLAGAAHFGGNLRQGMTWYAEAAALFRQLGDRRAMASSLAWLAFRCPTALNRMVALGRLHSQRRRSIGRCARRPVAARQRLCHDRAGLCLECGWSLCPGAGAGRTGAGHYAGAGTWLGNGGEHRPGRNLDRVGRSRHGPAPLDGGERTLCAVEHRLWRPQHCIFSRPVVDAAGTFGGSRSNAARCLWRTVPARRAGRHGCTYPQTAHLLVGAQRTGAGAGKCCGCSANDRDAADCGHPRGGDRRGAGGGASPGGAPPELAASTGARRGRRMGGGGP
jgi:tetratricopeptide (TPR) repeat protein